ncbi:Aureobasidin resistance protein Aur1 [Entomortierella lignicola]|nr:Aureobasidin resistance protein Aur1 [Entomortierella lignicola]
MLASSTAPWKDILAWMPYGIFHFVMPLVVALLFAIFAPSGTLPVFARTFGYMNIAGVLTQLFFPCAPPWYETKYGPFQPATYSMPGDPGGLVRVDDILGTDMYRSTFTASPLVFGAFPSLHSGCAWQLAFFVVYVFGPLSMPIALIYVFWIWWAAMYLGHHYVVDLVGGGCYAVVAFWIGSSFLPSIMPNSDMLPSQVEKQKLVENSDYALVGTRSSEDWGLEMDNRDKEVKQDAVTVAVEEDRTGYPLEMAKDGKNSNAVPSSSSSYSSQGLNGWHGFESWAFIMMSMRSGRSGYNTPQHYPTILPRFLDKSSLQGLSISTNTDTDDYNQDQRQQEQQQQQSSKTEIGSEIIVESISPSLSPSLSPLSPLPSPGYAKDSVSTAGGSFNVAISTAMMGEADENNIKRYTRSVHLSTSPTSSVSGSSLPNSPLKASFQDTDIIVPATLSVTTTTVSNSTSSMMISSSYSSSTSPSTTPSIESSRDSNVGLLLAGSSSPNGLFVSTSINKRFKDD